MLLPLFLAAVTATFLAMWATDDSNVQIGVPVTVAAGVALPLPEGGRAVWFAGIFVGLIAYTIFFVAQRGRRVAMPDYAHADGVPAVALGESAGEHPPNASRPTPSTPDGPYYVPGSPRKNRLAEDGTPGDPMRFEGTVRDAEGRPVEGAALEIWHANGNGDYDNEAWNCRGHLYTGAEGRFSFETVRPFGYGKRSWSMAGVVDYRSAHFHVKIRKDDATFTTQIWFPDDDDRNPTDVAYSRFENTNVLTLDREGETWLGRFDFVV